MRRSRFASIVGFGCLLLSAISPCYSQSLPKGFVFLHQVDGTIVESIRYATGNNFVGRPLGGYLAPSCVLVDEAAKALASLQREVLQSGLTLVVFDCYRPAAAVADMVAYVSGKDQSNLEYHPKLRASQLVAGGYIARRSGHSSGGAVDLTLARMTSKEFVYLDMGTRFDFFDPLSHSESGEISEAAQKNRRYLIKVMDRAGFSNYAKEWWHFQYRDEPFKGVVFDFPIIGDR